MQCVTVRSEPEPINMIQINFILHGVMWFLTMHNAIFVSLLWVWNSLLESAVGLGREYLWHATGVSEHMRICTSEQYRMAESHAFMYE